MRTINLYMQKLHFSDWFFYKVIKKWILGTASRMWYGAISAKLGFPKNTATHVTKICAKPVRKSISQTHLKYTDSFHLDFGDLFLSVKNIQLKCVNVSVNNVPFLFVGIVLLLMNTETTKLVMWWKNSRVKTMCYKMICKK